MDVDNENFYDEIASLIPQPGDYSLEDLDEIIRSTDSHLDSTLDLNTFGNAFGQTETIISGSDIFEFNSENNIQNIVGTQQQPLETKLNFGNDYNCDFSTFSSPATSHQSAGYTSPYVTPARTSSPTLMDDDYFNPDDFINFTSDDDTKSKSLTTDKMFKQNDNYRNTPSPTGSCTSSSGSSTSGIQSDASSMASTTQNHNVTMPYEGCDELFEFIKFKSEKPSQDNEAINTSRQNSESDNDCVVKESEVLPATDSTNNNLVPFTVPLLPVKVIPNLQPVNCVQRTIIPIQTVSLKKVNPIPNVKPPTATKSENKIPANKIIVTQPVKLANTTTKCNEDATPQLTSPPNAKPKTIYLSSNDFKALMQKINTNGKKILGTNDQMPKIIMKTANGKVIAANKIISNPKSNTSSPVINNSSEASASNFKSMQFVSKMVKASGPMAIKHQPSKVVTSNVRSVAIMEAARSTLGHTKINRTDFNMLKGFNDEKLLKKQLRMLKNRESASLSRKKKKEYIEKLENRISVLEKQNYALKGENSSLRSQLMAFAQTCHCKEGNVSEFILNTLNMYENNESSFNAMDDASYLVKDEKEKSDSSCSESNYNVFTSTRNHIKIAPKPPNASPYINKGFRQRANVATVRRNVAVLFAMVCFISFNVGYFQNHLNKSKFENAIEASFNEDPIPQTGRRLLWVPNEHEFHEKTNRSKREATMANTPPPPLHFLSPVIRNTADRTNSTSAKDDPPIKRHSATASTQTDTYANSTLENMRLADTLHNWIGFYNYLNLTGNHIDQMEHLKFGTESYTDYNVPIGGKQKRKIIPESYTPEKHAKLNIEGGHNSFALFKPTEEYMKLFRGIKRQDDTFYVLSFSKEHILLSASSYNKTSSPKISLMLPARNPLSNGDIVLMQIDCEVKNTTELEIKSHMIPEVLKPFKFSRSVKVNPHGVANNETAGPSSTTTTSVKREETKEKPSPRTYFMMDPKNQTSSNSVNSTVGAANIVKRKRTIGKFNANDSVIGSGVLNVRNSSLFSRMRETVGSQTNGFLPVVDIKKFT